ncbi:MAG: zinc-dependent alcohol dehydrogenase [Hyphomicrobiaceae bacterium]
MNDQKPTPPRRSAGMKRVARAVWYTAPGKVELRSQPLAVPRPGEALVKTLFTGISRGTERLVHSGAVGESEWGRMQAPMQEGQFPFPVKYGYCAVGQVEAGPEAWRGKTVFCLHPHQDWIITTPDRLTMVPAHIPPRRATLAANMETALNALWDSGAGPADRIVVVGAGVVGLLIAYLAARLPGADVTVLDVAPERRAIVESFGAKFAAGGQTHGSDPIAPADVVFHTSVTAAGLNAAIACAGFEARIVELSWYGDKDVPAKLGGAFHSQRLQLISSQVGHVSASRRARWDYGRRMAAALKLLDDPRLDQLVAEAISFDDAASALPKLLAPGATGLAPVIRY